MKRKNISALMLVPIMLLALSGCARIGKSEANAKPVPIGPHCKISVSTVCDEPEKEVSVAMQKEVVKGDIFYEHRNGYPVPDQSGDDLKVIIVITELNEDTVTFRSNGEDITLKYDEEASLVSASLYDGETEYNRTIVFSDYSEL